jgi:hypothetical protein
MAREDGKQKINLVRTIAGDVHFWIPLVVLLAGLFLLRKLG